MKGWNKEEGEGQGRRRLDAAHSRDARQWAGVGGDGARDPRSFPRVCFIYKKKTGGILGEYGGPHGVMHRLSMCVRVCVCLNLCICAYVWILCMCPCMYI